jgi:hypothetical protein
MSGGGFVKVGDCIGAALEEASRKAAGERFKKTLEPGQRERLEADISKEPEPKPEPAVPDASIETQTNEAAVRALPQGDDWKYRKLAFHGELGLFGAPLSRLSDQERSIYLDLDYLARKSPDNCLTLTLPEPTSNELRALADVLNRRGRNVRTYQRAVQSIARAGLLIPESVPNVSRNNCEIIAKLRLPLLEKELANFKRFSAAGKIGNQKQKKNIQGQDTKGSGGEMTGQTPEQKNSAMTGPYDNVTTLSDPKDLEEYVNVQEGATVDSATRSPAGEPGSVEEKAQTVFYALWPDGPFQWEKERRAMIALVRRYKPGAINTALVQMLEHRAEGKDFGNEIRYFTSIVKGEHAKLTGSR